MDSILQFQRNLNRWFVDHEYKGKDPYQLDEKASGLISKMPFLKYVRKLVKPLHVFIPSNTFSSFPDISHPKALGLIIGGNSFLYQKTGDKALKEQNKCVLELLKAGRNTEYKYYAWGSPFEWGSNPRYPVNTPAVCLITPIANALLDYYEIMGSDEALEMCTNISKHIIEENGFRELENGSTCLYYSPLDKNEVFNSNALAAKFFFRLAHISGDSSLTEIAKRIIKFVIGSQLDDGSWYYSNNSIIIDNRHTGFILESMAGIGEFWEDETLVCSLNRGLRFYKEELTDVGLPRWSPDKTYPIDIHDIAQAVLTFTASGDLELADFIARFAIDKMSNGQDEFYFKYFKNGKVNKNVFYRWGQAWMYYALGRLMTKTEVR